MGEWDWNWDIIIVFEKENGRLFHICRLVVGVMRKRFLFFCVLVFCVFAFVVFVCVCECLGSGGRPAQPTQLGPIDYCRVVKGKTEKGDHEGSAEWCREIVGEDDCGVD